MSDVLLFHTSDGASWASYLANKLKSEMYELPVRTEELTPQMCVFSAECSVQVVLMTPALLNIASENKSNLLGLIPTRCVVILLGAEEKDVNEVLGSGEERDSVFQCKVHCVDHDSQSVNKTIVAIIETFEEYIPVEDDMYSVPPPPKQINNVFEVLPKQAQQGDNFYILLDRKSDKDVSLRFDTIDEGIVTDCLDKAVYCCKIPENIKGDVHFSVMSDEQSLGEEHVIVNSKLDALRGLLQDVVNPAELMCQALGLQTASTKALDEALLKRLKMNSSPSLLQPFVLNDDVCFTDEKNQTIWPTPLHFAAEYNLEKLTEELLGYPGMLSAACTENINKEYPSSIAERNGFKMLEKKLVNFVLKQKDSGIYPDAEPPHPCSGHSYINQCPLHEDDEEDATDYVAMNPDAKLHDYIHMASFPKQNMKHGKSRKAQLFMNNRGYSEGDAEHISFVNASETENPATTEPFPNLKEHNLTRPVLPAKTNDRNSQYIIHEDFNRCDGDDIYNTPPAPSPVIPPRKISMQQQHSSSPNLQPVSPITVEVTQASPPPPCRPNPAFLTDHMFDSASSETSSVLDADTISQDRLSTISDKPVKRNTSIQTKISSFMRKLRPRFGSSSDVHKVEKTGRKTKFYTKSDPGLHDPVVMASVCKERVQLNTEVERDSGSYSEEEDEVTKTTHYPKKEGKKVKSKGNKSTGLQRERSVRVNRALQDDTRGAPTVPSKT